MLFQSLLLVYNDKEIIYIINIFNSFLFRQRRSFRPVKSIFNLFPVNIENREVYMCTNFGN